MSHTYRRQAGVIRVLESRMIVRSRRVTGMVHTWRRLLGIIDAGTSRGWPSRLPLLRVVVKPALTHSQDTNAFLLGDGGHDAITALRKIPQESKYCSVKLR